MDNPTAYAFYATLMLMAYVVCVLGVFGAWRDVLQ